VSLQDVLHPLVLVGTQVERAQDTAPTREPLVAAGAAPARAVPEGGPAPGNQQRERASRDDTLRHPFHGSPPCPRGSGLAVIAVTALADVAAVVAEDHGVRQRAGGEDAFHCESLKASDARARASVDAVDVAARSATQ